MAIRNHITQIKSADVYAKETEKSEAKTTAETKKADPVNAEEIIEKHTKNKDTEVENPEAEFAHPATSKASGGKEVSTKAKQ